MTPDQQPRAAKTMIAVPRQTRTGIQQLQDRLTAERGWTVHIPEALEYLLELDKARQDIP